MAVEVTFRALQREDLTAVEVLARRIWQITYPSIITQAQIDSMLAARYCPEALTAYLSAEDRWFEVVEYSGQLAGFCATEIHRGEFKLDKLYVDPALQHKGIGGRLIERAAERARLGANAHDPRGQ